MKYTNAAEILPQNLLQELQTYISGDIIYIPRANEKKQWGADSGSRTYYRERNSEIKAGFRAGISISQLAEQYGLACSTVKKIIYR